MKAVVQRVSSCVVRVEGREVSRIGKGLLVLLGVAREDGEEDVLYVVKKVVNLRVFEDEEGRMNRSLADAGGEIMLVSQFTLLGDVRKGRRPSYTEAAPPEKAEKLYLRAAEAFADAGHPPACGVFGAHMEVELVNDGPVTLIIETGK
jgi:D-tyrosyl-tRNA(Tyr) deacylase